MPSSSNPSSGPHDPFDQYKVSEIQKDKEPHDAAEGQPQWEPPHHSAFAAYVSLLFKKLIDLFEETTNLGLTVSAETDVIEHLRLFKAALEILKMEDRSQDAPFLNSLSMHWHQLLDDVLRFRRQSPLSLKMRAFIKEFQQYPAHQEHSLGYYLTEYAGQKWLPFPYMEMIQKLHMQHKKSPENSNLSSWTKEFDELIQILQPPKNLPTE
jgi:hypothetical protein